MSYYDDDINRNSMYRLIFKKRSFSNKIKSILKEIPDGSRILDYGCMCGTFGKLGNVIIGTKNLFIDGLDISIDNDHAIYHKHEDVKVKYDILLVSHVLEHMSMDEIDQFFKWSSCIADRLIIVLPNSNNIFVNFYCSEGHRTHIDNPDILLHLHGNGWKADKIIYAGWRDPTVKTIPNIIRFILSASCGKSPFYHVIVRADLF